MTLKELRSIQIAGLVDHNGHLFSDVKWLPKTCEYTGVIGGRRQGIPHAVIQKIQRRYADHWYGKAKFQNDRLRDGFINPERWKKQITPLLISNDRWQDFLVNGGLDTEYMPKALSMIMEEPFFRQKHLLSQRYNSKVLDRLARSSQHGAFGKTFVPESFDEDVKKLIYSANIQVARGLHRIVK